MRRKVIYLSILLIIFSTVIIKYSPLGLSLRVELAWHLMSTRYQDETSLLVGKVKRDQLIKEFHDKYAIE
ncbi:hypothetical protein DFQ01_13034 [Paenibacillus cellulosilyticus]|uniref:Uncharacterized protein n=1 Tax=Paenibacillus cellulosilyticus TaxID=375489 RepID=A0A2V2YLG6_9BACL|nr:hypothetical protein DFQ01_13034 [Paenibacillus cellulosilyticus]